MKNKFSIVDEVVVEHRDKNGKLIRRHKLNSGLIHRFLVKLHLAHNSMSKTGFSDIANWISGLSAPTAYTYVLIGSGTTADAVGDTAIGTLVKGMSCTPALSSTAQTNDTITWAFVFSSSTASGGSMTGSSAIDEVAIATATTAYHMLLHIAGTGTAGYGAVDNCQWSNGDTLSITIKCQVEQGA